MEEVGAGEGGCEGEGGEVVVVRGGGGGGGAVAELIDGVSSGWGGWGGGGGGGLHRSWSYLRLGHWGWFGGMLVNYVEAWRRG